jgi:hypothetical protein
MEQCELNCIQFVRLSPSPWGWNICCSTAVNFNLHVADCSMSISTQQSSLQWWVLTAETCLWSTFFITWKSFLEGKVWTSVLHVLWRETWAVLPKPEWHWRRRRQCITTDEAYYNFVDEFIEENHSAPQCELTDRTSISWKLLKAVIRNLGYWYMSAEGCHKCSLLNWNRSEWTVANSSCCTVYMILLQS